MTHYLTALFGLLAAAFMAGAVAMSPVEEAQPLSCDTVADDPVQQPAYQGDLGAMAFLGQQSIEDGCYNHAQAGGMQNLQRDATAGHSPAQSVRNAHGSPISACAALLIMMLSGVEDPHLIPGACD
ncbi:MAG: hypothetical protein AAFY52_05240 [Pseudomonadota bacterium]